MKMTIDEAIKHCLEVAEARETEVLKYNYCRGIPDVEKVVSDCKECAADHRQLAEWLKELKEAKRLLKVAMEDMNALYDFIGIKFKWRFADEALKLIGKEEGE